MLHAKSSPGMQYHGHFKDFLEVNFWFIDTEAGINLKNK